MTPPARGPIRIATRASSLALWQARHTAKLLHAADADCQTEIVHISTLGDRDQTEPLSQFGGMGVFTREVQKAVLEGRADLAVHSLKDLPTEAVDGLALGAVPERASMYDALVLPSSADKPAPASAEDILAALPPKSRVGTGSPRRRAQLLHRRGDLSLLEIRGNVETRLRKLDAGDFDAIVLAEAGLRRLGFDERISALLTPPIVLPAVGQGALGIECRADDADLLETLAQISHSATLAAVTAERALLAELRAGCHAPLGVSTSHSGDELTLEAVVLSLDGTERLVAQATMPTTAAIALGKHVAAELLSQGADRLIASQQ